ncbi:MAG: LLM class flavin-dependent oxidoreductase [Anaerolineae bacterium]
MSGGRARSSSAGARSRSRSRCSGSSWTDTRSCSRTASRCSPRSWPVTWRGTTRPPLTDQRVYLPTASGRLPVWMGVGGTPASVVARRYGMPLMLAIIGGDPLAFAPYAQYYRDALAQLGRETLPIGVHSPGFVAETDEAARDELFPHFAAMYTRIGRERGWPPR